MVQSTRDGARIVAPTPTSSERQTSRGARRPTPHRVVALRTAEDVALFSAGLSWHDRPWKVELRSPGLTPRAAERLARDITACGCASGAVAGLIAFVVLGLFARGAFSLELVAFWVAAVVGATVTAKVGTLLVTHWRARRGLAALQARLDGRAHRPHGGFGRVAGGQAGAA